MAGAVMMSGDAIDDEGLPFLPSDWPHRDRSDFVVSSGCRWHVQRMGQGPCLILIHGTAASTHTWRDMMPLLAEHYEVLAMDLPGHGYSERLPDRSMTLPSLATAVADLFETLDVRPAHLVGHSAGAAIALDLAVHRSVMPETVSGINSALLPFGGVLKNVFSPMARFFASTHLMPRMLARRARDRKAVIRVLEGTGSRLDSDGLFLYQCLLQRESHLAAVLDMMATWDLHPLINDLPKLKPELMLIVGGQDKAVSPKEAGKIREMLPSLQVVELESLGHLAHEEAPDRVVGLIRTFAESAS